MALINSREYLVSLTSFFLAVLAIYARAKRKHLELLPHVNRALIFLKILSGMFWFYVEGVWRLLKTTLLLIFLVYALWPLKAFYSLTHDLLHLLHLILMKTGMMDM